MGTFEVSRWAAGPCHGDNALTNVCCSNKKKNTMQVWPAFIIITGLFCVAGYGMNGVHRLFNNGKVKPQCDTSLN